MTATQPTKGSPVLYRSDGRDTAGVIGDLREYGKANIDLETGRTIWGAEQGEEDGQWRLVTDSAADSDAGNGEDPTEREVLAAEHARLTGKNPHPAMKLDKLRAKVAELQAEERETAPAGETEPQGADAAA